MSYVNEVNITGPNHEALLMQESADRNLSDTVAEASTAAAQRKYMNSRQRRAARAKVEREAAAAAASAVAAVQARQAMQMVTQGSAHMPQHDQRVCKQTSNTHVHHTRASYHNTH